jgi:hypothetical protein
MKSKPGALVTLTIGHSRRTIEELLRLPQAHAGTGVVDVRTAPPSRHYPQFNRNTLPDFGTSPARLCPKTIEPSKDR